ncbi:hypothetical protein CRP143_gp21 [Roseobacter phage CRP-143]|nr:hypothetical protein CRP143_gp21 [Roseobacter phage CRP-143]
MNQDRKAEIFNELATSIDSFAWVSSNTLKAKFGVVDDEEEYKKIEQEVVDYAASAEFAGKVKESEIVILNAIAATALKAVQELEDGND